MKAFSAATLLGNAGNATTLVVATTTLEPVSFRNIMLGQQQKEPKKKPMVVASKSRTDGKPPRKVTIHVTGRPYEPPEEVVSNGEESEARLNARRNSKVDCDAFWRYVGKDIDRYNSREEFEKYLNETRARFSKEMKRFFIYKRGDSGDFTKRV